MAVFSVAEVLKLIRQPAVWVSPVSYIAGYANNANVVAEASKMLRRREWPQDVLNPTTQDFTLPGVQAVPYDKAAVADVADTPYRPAFSGEAARSLPMKLIASSFREPLNYDDLIGDHREFGLDSGQWTAENFQTQAILDTVRAEVERQLFLGDSVANPLEFSGFLAGDYPRQVVAAGAVDVLAAIDEGVEAIHAGGGVSRAEAIFCHGRARRFIAAMRAAGFEPPHMFVPQLGYAVTAVPTVQGLVPLIRSDFIPISPTGDTTSLIIVHLSTDTGVHLAVPLESPLVRVTDVRNPNRPERIIIAEHKSVLAAIDNNTTVEIPNIGPV